jgi:peroxiredoxin
MKQTVPQVTFKTRVRDEAVDGPNPFRWQDVSSEDIFTGKRIVLFALPGAFTPTCSSTHLPGYESDYAAFRELGVDEVYCLSVNDAFTMFQWGRHMDVRATPCWWRTATS